MRTVYLGVLFFLSIGFRAVEAQTSTFTLDQCIAYALENNLNVQTSILDERIASARVREVTGQGLPQVNGSMGIVHNQKLPRFFTTYSPSGFLRFDTPHGSVRRRILRDEEHRGPAAQRTP